MRNAARALVLVLILSSQGKAIGAELKEDDPSLKGAPLGALLIDLAGSALQRQSAMALAVEAGESGTRARLDLPLRTGYFHDKRRLDFRLSGPIDLEAEASEGGETDIFGDAIALEGAFTYIRWNPGSPTSESMRSELCTRFKRRFLDGNEAYKNDGTPHQASACTERYFTKFNAYLPVPAGQDPDEFRKNLVAAWRTAYLAWNHAAEQCSHGPVVVPVDEQYAAYLPPAPPMPEDCVKAKTKNLLIFRMGLAGGYRKIDRVNSNNTAVSEEREHPYAATLSVGWYMTNNFSLTLGADYQSFFESGDEKSLCSGDAGSTPLVCATGLSGGAREESPGVALDFGHRPASFPLAYRIIAQYRAKDDLATVRMPIFLATSFKEEVDQLGGGVEVSWDNASEETRFSLFVGRTFNSGN